MKPARHRSAVQKSVYDYTKDVRDLLRRISYEPGSYTAALYNRDSYPTFPLETPLGDVSVRLLGASEAVVESPSMAIYGVAYRVFAHLVAKEGAWTRYDGVTGFERLDRKWDHGLGPARRRFDATALPAIAAFLDDEDIADARAAAQAIRLAWELETHHGPNLQSIDTLIAELTDARAAITATIATNRTRIAAIHAQLREAVA